MYKLIIDADVWIKYARAKDIAPLLSRFKLCKLVPVVNNYLLSEVFNALIENKWMNKRQANSVINFIRNISIEHVETVVYRLSPDPKDNYLFDLAIQNNCIFIITNDTALLDFKMQTVPVHSSKWFLKKFPV
jgi:putative PIN family toxin of toxin-antitoxin system